MSWSFRTSGNFVQFVHTESDVSSNPYWEAEEIVFNLHNTSTCIDWSIGDDTSVITFTIDEKKYENIPVTDIDFDGTPLTDASEFPDAIRAVFTGLAPSPGGLESVVAGDGIDVDDTDPANPVVSATGSSYLSYVALFSQSGTSAPTTTELQNTLGGPVVWTRAGVGEYHGTLAGAFTENKTYIPPFDKNGAAIGIPIQILAGSVEIWFSMGWLNANAIFLLCYDADANLVEWGDYTITPMALPEVRVYP